MINNFFLFLLLSLFSKIVVAQPTVDQQLNNIRCAKEVKSLVYEKWKANIQWQKLISTDSNHNQYKSPSDNFGKWVYLTFKPNTTQAALKTVDEVLIISWSNDCQKEITKKELKDGQRARKITSTPELENQDIQKIIKESKNGVIYIWSPEMPYSVKAIEQIEKATKKMNVKLDILLSPNSDFNLAKKAANKHKLPKSYLRRHVSEELHHRGIDLHYPSLITYKNYSLNRFARYGYETHKYYSHYLKRIFSK